MSTMPPIATTRYYVDPDSNRTVSSSLICNWSQYESQYYDGGTTTTDPASVPSTIPGYYTVNSECSLLGVFPGILDNGTWHHQTATYPDPIIDLGSRIAVRTRSCPSTSYAITTTSVTYRDPFSSYYETFYASDGSAVSSMFWEFPEMAKYLSDVPPLSTCYISLGGSPAYLKGASYLTENVVLPRTTQASSTQAKGPAPDSSTVARPSAEPEPTSSTPASPVSRPDAIPTSSAPPASTPTQPPGSSEPDDNDSSPSDDSSADDDTNDSTPDSSTPDDTSPSSPSASPTQEDGESTPINQDPIWSAIGEIGQEESDTVPSANGDNTENSGGSQGVDTSAPNSSENADQSEDDTAVGAADQTSSGSGDSNASSDTSASGSTGNSGNLQAGDDPNNPSDTNGGANTDGQQTFEDSPNAAPVGVVVTATSGDTPVAFTVVPTNDESEEAIQSIVAANGASAAGDALVVGTQTIETGGPAVTISNNGATQALSIPAQPQGSAVVVTAIDSSGQEAVVTLSASGAADQDAVQSIAAAQGVSVNGDAINIGSQTLQPGGPAVTISDGAATQVLSLPGSSENDVVSVSVSAGDDGETQDIAISSDGDLDDEEVQSLLSANDAHLTDGVLVVGTQTLTPGGTGITLTEDGQTQVISLPALTPTAAVSGPLTIGSQVVYPGGAPITVTSNGRTEVISLPTTLPGSSGLVSSVVIANASTTTTEDIGDYICSVMGSCSTATTSSGSETLSAEATDTSSASASPTGAAGRVSLPRVIRVLAPVVVLALL